MNYLIAFVLVAIIGSVLAQSRSKNIENFGQFRMSNKQDDELAIREAYRQLCEKRGYKWINGKGNLDFDCVHTKKTCLNDAQVGVVGNEAFRKRCEDEGLTYDATTGRCKTNAEYCFKKGLAWCDDDCKSSPLMWLSEQMFGKTITRAFGFGSAEKIMFQEICKAARK